jgi:predicted SprT family Zn-dependent metalloprotease
MGSDDWVYVENPDDWVFVENPEWEPLECFDIAEVAHRNPNRSTKHTKVAELAKIVGGALGRFDVRRKIPVTFDDHLRRRSALGITWYKPSTRKVRVTFNRVAWPLLTPEERFDVALHEAAHAVQYASCGNSNHGPEWKRAAQYLGCTGNRCIAIGQKRMEQIKDNYVRRREGR